MITSPQAPLAMPVMIPKVRESCHRFCDRPMPTKPAAMRSTPPRITGRVPRSSAFLPNRTPPMAQPSIANT